jgi:hypothetical protein
MILNVSGLKKPAGLALCGDSFQFFTKVGSVGAGCYDAAMSELQRGEKSSSEALGPEPHSRRDGTAHISIIQTETQGQKQMPDPSHYCPNCSARLVDRGCKMKCPQCGYFLSCSDFY